MAEEFPHWRRGGSLLHIGVEVLPEGRDITVVIDHIVLNEKENVGGVELEKFVAYFKPNPYFKLPKLLVVKDKQRLIKMIGGDERGLCKIKDLAVILTSEIDKRGPEGKGPCLRISSIVPKQIEPEKPIVKQPLTLTSEKYEGLKKWLSETGTLTGLLKAYEPDEACLVELRKIKGV